MLRYIITYLVLTIAISAFAQQEIPLYDGKAPGSEDWNWTEGTNDENDWDTPVIYNVTKPSITAYIPPYYLATGTAVVIAPGGGLHMLSWESEGTQVAEWLRDKGIAAFVLKYRLAKSNTDDPVKEYSTKSSVESDARKVAPLAMADGLAAVKYIRKHASTFDVDPNKIGFIGFSAGGALTLNVARNATAASRPNFIAPIYPWDVGVIGTKTPKDSMPLFVSVALDDQLDLAPYSLDTYRNWIEDGQEAELHVYQNGGHGFGMREKLLPSDTWIERFWEWMNVQGFLQKLNPNIYEIQYGQETVRRGAKDRINQMENDYALLSRYKEANAKVNPPKAGEKRVVFLGNSITEGWAAQVPEFFSANNFIGRGISGQTSVQLLLRFRQDVIDLNPDAVVIHIGTNDIAENTGPYDPDYTMSNIMSMAQLAQTNDIKVILATVVPSSIFEWNRKLGDRSAVIVDLNNRIKKYAHDHSIPVIDYHNALRNDKNAMNPDIAEDGVHPNLKGFGIMEETALPVIKKVLEN